MNTAVPRVDCNRLYTRGAFAEHVQIKSCGPEGPLARVCVAVLWPCACIRGTCVMSYNCRVCLWQDNLAGVALHCTVAEGLSTKLVCVHLGLGAVERQSAHAQLQGSGPYGARAVRACACAGAVLEQGWVPVRLCLSLSQAQAPSVGLCCGRLRCQAVRSLMPLRGWGVCLSVRCALSPNRGGGCNSLCSSV